ncbi:MAG: TauD/TfdA family dioxygenase [Lautropia sp.]
MSYPVMLDRLVHGKRAWRQGTLRDRDWLIELSTEARDELMRIVEMLREQPRTTTDLRPGEFDLAACADHMRNARSMLDDGAGFVVLDRLPMDRITDHQAVALYWLLASMISRPVAQKFDGTMIYDVQDTGQLPLPGSGVRPDKTNVEQNFHNDNAYNRVQPDYVGLLCVSQAPSGGESAVVNVHTVHNELLNRFPQALSRLYGEFWIDRQKEHGADELPLLRVPIFEWNGRRLKMRMGLHTIFNGYAIRNEPMDPEAVSAIESLKSIFGDASLSHRFLMAPGQMQFVNNLEICHRRTAFRDGSDATRKRRMVRLWMRDAGSCDYDA